MSFDHAVVKHEDPDYVYNVQLKNVMVNRTDKAFSTYYCVKQRLYGDTFKLNIKDHRLLYNVPANLLFQFDIKVCNMLNNIFGAKTTLRNGNATICPVEKGCYKQDNFVLDDTKFPPLIPPNTYRIDMTYFFGMKSIAEKIQFTIDVKYSN